VILPAIIAAFFLGGILSWISVRLGPRWPRWVSLTVLSATLVVLVAWSIGAAGRATADDPWLARFDIPWIPALGIRFHLAVDGLSLPLLLLANVLGILAVATSWTSIRERIGFFHFNLHWILAAIAGSFLALDLFLFFFFWELMLIPLYFLISVWGSKERRIHAAVKFFIFTQGAGLFMLLGILGLHFAHGNSTGIYTFDYLQLLGTSAGPLGFPLMLAFFIAFAVKLPAVPFHTWLPDAHGEAPTAGSVHLAGLVLKVGAYGFLRFAIPLFPKESLEFAPAAIALGIVGILYGAVVAFGQTDLKRLVAYTSVSHMGFVLVGIYSWNATALQGALIIMLSHGLSTGGLFMLVGDLYERLHTRDLSRMGGLWSTVPRMGGLGMVLTMASLGLPGLGNFVGEFLVLLGLFKVDVTAAAIASLGFVAATVYSLYMIGRTFYGRKSESWNVPDSNGRELAIHGATIGLLLWLGLYPQPILDAAAPAIEALRQIVRW
jgi:NADH-quinone oxidoreductase subunit M